VTLHVTPRRHEDVEAHYAGFVSRLGAFAIDVFTVVILFSLAGAVVEWLVGAVSGDDFHFSQVPVVSAIVLALLAFVYCAYPLAMGGRTFGMTVLGLRVVRADGVDIGGRHAVIRVLAFPLSFLSLGIGFLMILIRGDRSALHDVIADTCVIYSWDPLRAGRRSRDTHTTRPAD
jgi:uncharacterized RDD family membrane protein YckC